MYVLIFNTLYINVLVTNLRSINSYTFALSRYDVSHWAQVRSPFCFASTKSRSPSLRRFTNSGPDTFASYKSSTCMGEDDDGSSVKQRKQLSKTAKAAAQQDDDESAVTSELDPPSRLGPWVHF